jgi:transmembrane sensor
MDVNERRRMAGTQAVEWWDRLHNDQLSLGVKQQYVEWLRETPLHVAEMLRVEKLHHELLHFENWVAISGEESIGDESPVIDFTERMLIKARPAPAETASVRRAVRRPWVAVLATAASVLVVGVTALLATTRDQVIQTMQADRREIALKDGSVVQMDPETRLRVRLEANERRVHIDQGRAVFHVAKDSSRPFLVDTAGTVVRAVGTAFGVEQRSREVIVTVAEGKVTVVSESASPVATTAPMLHADQQMVITAGVSGPVRDVDSTRELAWAKGRLIFNHQTVAEVVPQFNHYNRVQLRVQAPQIAARRISGVFDAADPESFVAFLEAGGAGHAVRPSQQLIVLTD